MCGISGGIFIKGDKLLFNKNIEQLFKKNKLRGADGFGYSTLINNKIYEVKNDNDLTIGSIFISVSRAQPLPEVDSSESCPPFTLANLSIVHNGTISNDKELNKEYNLNLKDNSIDTEIILHLINKIGYKKTCENLVGGFAIGMINSIKKELIIIRNFKTLYIAKSKEGIYFASEKEWLTNILKYKLLGDIIIEEVPFNSIIRINKKGKIIIEKFNKKIWSSLPQKDNNKAVIVTSGGIDSITSAYIAKYLHKKEIVLLNIDYGQRSSEKEKQAVEYFGDILKAKVFHYKLKDLGNLGASPLTDKAIELPLGMRSVESTLCWTPARNLLFIAYASSVAEATGCGYIYYGNNLEEEATGYSDNDLSFIDSYNHLLNLGTLQGVVIHRALARIMKPEILVLGKYLNVDYSKTWSCDEGFDLPCGICGCCTTRRYAFKRSGLIDEQKYLNELRDIYPWVNSKKYNLNNIIKRV
jgi:7-cyano-7-deazaguanine synthase